MVDTENLDETPKIGLLDVLGAELRELAQIGIGLKRRIAEAKTAPKRNLYQKKLEKNSKKAAEIILYLERVQIGKAIKENQEKQRFIDERNNEDGEVSDGAATGRRTSEEGSEA